eukprot:6203185-Pleurochrysis_carterae.AAC.1
MTADDSNSDFNIPASARAQAPSSSGNTCSTGVSVSSASTPTSPPTPAPAALEAMSDGSHDESSRALAPTTSETRPDESTDESTPAPPPAASSLAPAPASSAGPPADSSDKFSELGSTSSDDNKPIASRSVATARAPHSAPPSPPGSDDKDSDSVTSPPAASPPSALTPYQQALLAKFAAVPLSNPRPVFTSSPNPLPPGWSDLLGPRPRQLQGLAGEPIRQWTSAPRDPERLRKFEGPGVSRGRLAVRLEQLPTQRVSAPSEFDGRIFLNLPPLSSPSSSIAAPTPTEVPGSIGTASAVAEEVTPMEESETAEAAPAVAEASIVEPSPASAEETRDSEDMGLCTGCELIDKYPPLRHFATSVPINHYRRYDWLDWPTYKEDELTFIYDVRRETAPPSRLVAELHRAHLSAPYAVKTRHHYQMGLFDERCRALVMNSLQQASTNNVALYDKIFVLNGRAPRQETEGRLWECGRYASFHVAPLA